MKQNNVAMVAYTNYNTDPRCIREAESTVKAGYEVDFFALRRKEEPSNEIRNGVNVIRLPQSRYRGSSNLAYVLTYLQFFVVCSFFLTIQHFKRKYKVIHVNNIPDFMVFVAFIPKLMGAKVVLDIHDPMPSTFMTKFAGSSESIIYKLLKFQELWSAKFANAVTTVHEPLKQDILVKDGIPAEKIHVIANFGDHEHFKLRENYELGEKIKILFHGTIAERFGLENVCRVMAELDNRESYLLQIIGEGDASEQLKKWIVQYGVEDIVHFDHYFHPVEVLPDMIAQYDIGLVSYNLSAATEYMLPLKMVEYVTVGLPILTVPNKAIKYYFDSDDVFFYNEYDGPNSLKPVLEELAQNRDLIYEKRKRALEFRPNFFWRDQAEGYIKLLKSLTHENE